MKKHIYLFFAIAIFSIGFSVSTCKGQTNKSFRGQVESTLHNHIQKEAAWAMSQKPVTVTASICERSTGSKHDYYSEADYWWPDPENPDGPYIQRDGMTNPNNFNDHRKAMVTLSRVIGALASGYLLTEKDEYVKNAIPHLNAWFVNKETRMNPSLLYTQAIKGRATGRGIGIIDTIHLMEVVQGILAMQRSGLINDKMLGELKNWFREYLTWLTTHQYGIDEMNAENNHGTCWVMQVSCFARFVGDEKLLEFCRDRYKNILLSNQMDEQGGFPRELRRTKPYGYSLFNLDAMAMVCHILSDAKHDLWNYTIDGKSMKKGIEFLYPFVENKSLWTYKQDVMFWDNWPVAQPFLVFGANVFGNNEWLSTWKKLDHAPEVEEVLRNLPIRNPLIWLK